MTAKPIPRDRLLASRKRMIRKLQRGLVGNEREFLLSLVAGKPDWSLLDIPLLEQMPGIRWKLRVLTQLQITNAKKFAEQAEMLETSFEAVGSGKRQPS